MGGGEGDGVFHILLFKIAEDGFIGGEVGGVGGGEGDFGGGGEFGAALEGDLEGEAGHGEWAVSDDGVEDAAFAEVDDEEDGFVFVGAAGLGVGEGGSEDGDVFAGAAEFGVEFIGGVSEGLGEAFHDGVVGFAGFEEEGVLGAVGSAVAWGGIEDDFFVAVADHGA